MNKLSSYIVPAVTGVFIGISVCAASYLLGEFSGKNQVYLEWTQEKLELERKVKETQSRLNVAERTHLTETTRLQNEISQTNEVHQAELNRLKSDFDLRMQLSENRATVYRNQAKRGAAECGNLANHAAELDRTLEEGRNVVAELKEVVGLRDRQIIILSDQIKADRQILKF